MPSFRLTEDESWKAISDAHTSLLTTLRKDGRPITLPTWHIVIDRVIYVRTPIGAKKLARIRNDPRGYLLVETGRAWSELAAITVPVRCSVVADAEVTMRVRDAVDEKYAGLHAPMDRLPDAVRQTYNSMQAVRLDPEGRLSNWNNRALLGDDSAIDWS